MPDSQLLQREALKSERGTIRTRKSPGAHAFSAPKSGFARCKMDGTKREPMTSLDGFGTARMMIAMYGKEAQSEARRRCEKALKREDLPGFERWAHIATVIGGFVTRSAVSPAHL